MTIPVEVPGLDTIIPTLDEGNMLVVESGADPAKSFFVRRLGLTAIREEIPVTFVTSRDRAELLSQLELESPDAPWREGDLTVVEEDSLTETNGYGATGGFLAVDSFSFLTLDLPGARLARLLRGLRGLSHEKRTIVLLATDRGMADPRSEAVVNHLADGVLQFHAREGPEGVVRFLRIPKWIDGRFFDRNIYYQFDGSRIAVDLRRRVL